MKKKDKKKIKKLAKNGIKILKNGKIKIGNVKVPLKPFIDGSMDKIICSRLQAIPSAEDVVLDGAVPVEIGINLSSKIRCLEVAAKIIGTGLGNNTVVEFCSKHDALSDAKFDFLSDSIIGSLMRTSTLASMLKPISKKWDEMNKNDTTGFTNVLYIPNIYVFLDRKTGEISNQPYKTNLLLVAVPERKYASTSDTGTDILPEEISITKYASLVCKSVLDSAVAVGAKHLIIDPFEHPDFDLIKIDVAETFTGLLGQQHYIEQLSDVEFTIDDDSSFVIFSRSKK